MSTHTPLPSTPLLSLLRPRPCVSCALQPPRSPAGEEDEGTPKVPLVAWGGRPGRVCPGAPRKGKAPDDFFTVRPVVALLTLRVLHSVSGSQVLY
jgi:hypothetical protein